MLHAKEPLVRQLLLQGEFGLELESLRVDEHGFFSHTPHPFGPQPHITRDFCENQVEINTPVVQSPRAAVESLAGYLRQVQRRLAGLPQREYLWPFSNPPYIRSEADIPIARFTGPQAEKTAYREYLSDRYGRYKMTLSGIHVNYSFAETLLQADFALGGGQDFAAYKSRLYLHMAERTAAYGWLLTAVTAASPLMDSSFVEKGRFDGEEFGGMGSVRCSELGYWNYFTPVMDYASLPAYTASLRAYVEDGLLCCPAELYYPVRLKPAGSNDLDVLEREGVNHLELRMFDLNPLAPACVEERDVAFAQLLLVWLACLPRRPLSRKEQVQAAQNFKNAAHYDLKTVKILAPDGSVLPAADAALGILGRMKAFYAGFPQETQDVLAFEEAKFLDAENRYAWQVRRRFAGGFVHKGLALARRRQELACEAPEV